MEILTERLRLRCFKLSDAEEYYSITQDEAIQNYLSEDCADTLINTQKIIEKIMFSPDSDFCIYEKSFVIEDKATNKMIGALLADESGTFLSLDMHLMVAKEYRRKGYMTEALKGFIESMPKGTLLSFHIKEGNEPPLATIRKLGELHEENNFFDKRLEYRVFYFTV